MKMLKSLYKIMLPSNTLSSVPSADDVFLVSYPKSGNTWMRFLLSNLLKENQCEKINFYNIHEFCPEWEKRNYELEKLTTCQIYKSHRPYDVTFQKVIYMIRDPRDVYISYYHFLKNMIPSTWDLADFIENYNSPYGNWSSHVLSWVGRKREHVLIIKYEDLLLNSYGKLLEIVNFSSMETDGDRIRQAIEQSSFKEMSQIEKKEGRKYGDGGTIFVRKGEAGQWRDIFGEKELTAFRKREDNSLLEKMGYAD